jgi:hypothetical protein
MRGRPGSSTLGGSFNRTQPAPDLVCYDPITEAGSVGSFYSWMFRVLLPLSLGLLGATLGAIWPDPRHFGWMDIAGSASLVLAMVGVALWTFSVWISD